MASRSIFPVGACSSRREKQFETLVNYADPLITIIQMSSRYFSHE